MKTRLTATAQPLSGNQQVSVTTFGIIVLGSFLFSLKGVFAKLAFTQGADPLEVLTLRMACALPFFAGIWLICEFREGMKCDRARIAEIGQLAVLGFIGYYVSSMLDFIGLQYVSAGLERIILFSYPTIVLFLSVRFFGYQTNRLVIFACGLTWVGVAFSFVGEISHTQDWSSLTVGGALIFLCALTYALFVVLSSRLLKRMGSTRFTSGAMTFSALFMVSHYVATRPIGELINLSGSVLGIGAFLGIGGTVIPGYLMIYGLKHSDPSRFAIISSAGPVTTVFAAYFVLGEVPAPLQWFGFALTIVGGLAVVISKEKS